MMEPSRPFSTRSADPLGFDAEPASVGGKVRRIGEQTRALVDDLRTWVDLQIKKTKLEIQEQIDELVSQLKLVAALGFVAFLFVLFFLFTLAFALGAWLGHPAWGFLIVTVLLGVALGVLGYTLKNNPTALNKTTRKVVVADKELQAPPPKPTLPPVRPPEPAARPRS